jgi:hypothetical protein
VTDNMTGLIWLANANCFGLQTWPNAMAAANTLASGACSLTDGSVAGAWRLPNVREQQSLVDYNYFFPAVPDTPGTGQWTRARSSCTWPTGKLAPPARHTATVRGRSGEGPEA